MSTTTKHRTHDRSQGGFTFAEVLMATVITGFAVLSSSWALSAATSSRHELEAEPFTASLLAKEIYECAQSLPKAPSGTVGVQAGADLVALDCLIGASFSPPIRANGSTYTDLAGWTQKVDLEVYDLADLSTPSGQDAWLGLKSHDPCMYQLAVTVQKDGVDIDTYRWWITP